jgi:hypothetical protein
MGAQRMSNADAAWLHMDRPTNLMVVNALLWFEEPVDASRVREILRSRLVEPFPRFRQLVTEPRLGVGVTEFSPWGSPFLPGPYCFPPLQAGKR